MADYKKYRRTAIAEMADWHPDFDMTDVSVSEADGKAGSPKLGDKIARNPKNHDDRWLVAADYFADNFEPTDSPTPKQREERESPEWQFLWDVIRAGCHTHHAVAGDIDACAKCDHDIRHPIHSPSRVYQILSLLRTHSLEEPVGYFGEVDWGDGRGWIRGSGTFKTREEVVDSIRTSMRYDSIPPKAKARLVPVIEGTPEPIGQPLDSPDGGSET